MEVMREFPDDDTCLDWLWRDCFSAAGEHADCPKCEQSRVFHRHSTAQQRQALTCTAHCRHIHPTAGTIFHKSSTSLHLWFYAIYMMTSTRCGISAMQLERELGATYKTAWRMGKLIVQELMAQDDEPPSGTVEADEAHLGGRNRGVRNGRTGADPHKVPASRIVEHKGRVAVYTDPNVKGATLLPHIIQRVIPASTNYTDEYRFYDALTERGFKHGRIRHAEGVYVSGNIHPNTIEAFWSLVMRGFNSVYHSVSAKHL